MGKSPNLEKKGKNGKKNLKSLNFFEKSPEKVKKSKLKIEKVLNLVKSPKFWRKIQKNMRQTSN